MSLFDKLPHTFSASRVTAQHGQFIGSKLTKASSPYLEDEPGFIQPANAAEIKEFAARNMVVTHRIFLARDPEAFSIKLSDLIDVTSGPYNGKELTVRAWVECTAGLGNGWKIMTEINRET